MREQRRRAYPCSQALVGRAIGATFCVTWAVSLVLFPVIKGLPAGLLLVAIGIAFASGLSLFRTNLTSCLGLCQPTTFLIAVSGLGLVARTAACVYFPLEPANDHEMFYRIAAGVAEGRGYIWGGAPSAFFPPGMPLLLAGTFAVFGSSLVVAKVVGLAIGTALVPLSYQFARQAVSEPVARWTALLVACSPTLVFYSATIGYEQLLAAVVLGWAGLTAGMRADQSDRWRLVTSGALAGTGALIKPISLLLPAISLAVWLARMRITQALARAAIMTVVMLAVIAPWTFRNWRVLGHPVLLSTNGGFVLYSANNDASLGIATPVEPLPGEVDEVSRDRLRRKAALRWIGENPGPFLKLAVAKAVYGWGTSSSIMSFVSADRLPPRQEDICKAILNVGWAGLFTLCALGTWRTRVWSHPRLTPALLFLIYLFAVHLVYEALSRHHITVIPVLAIIAAAGLANADREVSTREAPSEEQAGRSR